MFYQFCDLEVKEAQDLIRVSLKKGSKEVCDDEKNGWYVPGTDQKLREILVKEISKQLDIDNVSQPKATDEDEEEEEQDDDSNMSESDSDM